MWTLLFLVLPTCKNCSFLLTGTVFHLSYFSPLHWHKCHKSVYSLIFFWERKWAKVIVFPRRQSTPTPFQKLKKENLNVALARIVCYICLNMWGKKIVLKIYNSACLFQLFQRESNGIICLISFPFQQESLALFDWDSVLLFFLLF